jgi:hypothetical protein
MAFHLSLFDASIANGTTLIQVAALADPFVAPANSGFLVHPTLNQVMRVASVGTNLTRTQLSSATIRQYAIFDIAPVNVGTIIGTPARYQKWDLNPLVLAVNEELDALGVQSNAGAQRITVAVLFCDGPVRPISQRAFTVHWTATTTLVANTFTSFLPVFDNGIPAGTFAIVGARVLSAGALFYRLISRGGISNRPGWFAVQAQSDDPRDDSRYGGMGEFMRFSNVTPPQIEVFSRSADNTEEGYFDLVQVG